MMHSFSDIKIELIINNYNVKREYICSHIIISISNFDVSKLIYIMFYNKLNIIAKKKCC